MCLSLMQIVNFCEIATWGSRYQLVSRSGNEVLVKDYDPDDDNDDMTDVFENDNGLDPFDSSNAGLDPDNDGRGTPLHVLQELGGWSDYKMVRRNAHLSVARLAEHAETLPEGQLM